MKKQCESLSLFVDVEGTSKPLKLLNFPPGRWVVFESKVNFIVVCNPLWVQVKQKHQKLSAKQKHSPKS